MEEKFKFFLIKLIKLLNFEKFQVVLDQIRSRNAQAF